MLTSQPDQRGQTSLRTPITLVVLLGILVAGAYYGWLGLTADLTTTTEPTAPTTTAPTPKCTPSPASPAKQLTTHQVRVSVFNAGGITGLASQTLADLRAKGFREGNTDNAPEGSVVEAVQVWDADPNSPQARLVAMQFDGKVQRVRSTTDLGPGIDVVIGDAFPGVKETAPRSIQIQAPSKGTDCGSPSASPSRPGSGTGTGTGSGSGSGSSTGTGSGQG